MGRMTLKNRVTGAKRRLDTFTPGGLAAQNPVELNRAADAWLWEFNRLRNRRLGSE
jgi:hypothetical protein